MKKFIYYTKEGKFETDDYFSIPFKALYSPNEETPSVIYPSGTKKWYFKGKFHRLTGPAVKWEDGVNWFYLNGKEYTFENWLKYHPNQEQSFQALMKLCYN